ncbi:MAG: S-methyl-5'-thioadenosine phosphorylase, partial [Proteobacteria bacterium]|nr:S-methyl-5'-thioadenosine phosphorylase [Pseudomonadota bacterium]
GIIGGSGLDNPDILKNPKDVVVETPYGTLTSPLRSGTIGTNEVLICARHGREHTDPPTQVNYRGNIWALKDQGCDLVLATTAVGSLREKIDRGHLVILDQFIDFTRLRPLTFCTEFPPHQPQHTPMAEPFDATLRAALISCCTKLGITHHEKGTVITIEGPRFSTKAESHMFRAWGADVINMSVAPECILACEIGLPYAAVAMSTDYDCWKDDEAPVTWDDILKTFNENAEKVTNLLVEVISAL